MKKLTADDAEKVRPELEEFLWWYARNYLNVPDNPYEVAPIVTYYLYERQGLISGYSKET